MSDSATADPSASQAAELQIEPTPQQRRGMRNAILAQCTGTLALKAFESGIILTFLNALGLPSAWVLVALATPQLILGVFQVPLAYMVDRYGKKLFGNIGVFCNTVGMLVFVAASLMGDAMAQPLALLGSAIYGVGLTTFGAGWFALLSPVVPETMRGRFFGRLRYSWQSVSIIFSLLCIIFLGDDTTLGTFRVVLLILAATSALRWVFYAGIPELEEPRKQAQSLVAVIMSLLRETGYLAFGCYIFLICLFTGSCLFLFGLIEKRVLDLGDYAVVILGTVTMVGSFVGYLGVGRIIDRWGTKRVFVGCHVLYGLVCLGYLMRGLAGDSLLMPYLIIMHLGFGLAFAAASVAISTEMLALIPTENKSVSTSLLMSMFYAGNAVSGIISGWAVDSGMLADNWVLLGQALSRYDSLLLGCGVMIFILVVTLGLVPSVIAKAQPFPRGS